jgi:hypothetical protein
MTTISSQKLLDFLVCLGYHHQIERMVITWPVPGVLAGSCVVAHIDCKVHINGTEFVPSLQHPSDHHVSVCWLQRRARWLVVVCLFLGDVMIGKFVDEFAA